ncbi:MAG: hypothetical protein JWL61_172 [Gemmatimonadetes bacterium]|nr:hypothetical protein [Gemmatimonadota bacterium]
MNAETLIALAVTVAVLAYLVYTLIRPEKF